MILLRTNKLPGILLIVVSIFISTGAGFFFSPHSKQTIYQPKTNKFAISNDKPTKLKRIQNNSEPSIFQSEESENALPVVYKSGTLSGDQTWQAGYVYMLDSTVQIPSGVTLNISGGAIVKYSSWGNSIVVNSGGNLNITGIPGSPVTFTSYKDDAAGGDTTGDGNSSSPAVGDYGTGIYNYGTATIDYGVFRYADTGIAGGNGTGTHLSVTNSTFSQANYAISASAQDATLQRNQFNVNPAIGSDGAVSLSGLQDMSDIALSGANKNIFIGSNLARLITFTGATLPYGKTMTIASESGAVPQIDSYHNIGGVLNIDNGVMLLTRGSGVKVTGTLNLAPNTIVRFGSTSTNITVDAGGELNAAGTQASPIIFTSNKDDAAGGDTNGNGSSPQVGDYMAGIYALSGANISISHAQIAYAGNAFTLGGQSNMHDILVQHVGTAFSLDAGEAQLTDIVINSANIGLDVSQSKIIFRGSITNTSYKAIRACNCGSSTCSVDASYTDWGSVSGPNTSSATSVCGKVTIAPWISGSTTVNGGLFGSPNCDGSDTPDTQVNNAAQNFSNRMAQKGIDCSGGFQDACNAMTTAQNCLGAATSLAASTSSFPLPNGNAYDQPAQWGNMLASNASDFIQSVEGPVPILSAASFATNLLGAVTTILNIANAYNTCAP